jgi:hypothetical protein
VTSIVNVEKGGLVGNGKGTPGKSRMNKTIGTVVGNVRKKSTSLFGNFF